MARRRGRRGRSRSLWGWLVLLLVVGLGVGLEYWRRHQGEEAGPTTRAMEAGINRPIRIATWNLKKFSERARPDVVAIGEIVKSSGFDLLAIQEVQQEGQVVQRLRRQLNEPWRHVISEVAGNFERYAFLYRGDVIEMTEEPKLLETSVGFARRPWMGRFRAGQFDFVLVTVHMWYGAAGGNDRRRQEVAGMARIARELAGSSTEKDVIVLGDFNEFRSSGYLRYFEEQGWKRLVREPTNLSSTEAYDSILIDPRFTREFSGQAGVVPFDRIRYGSDRARAVDDVSDHRPAWADFRTDLADDD